MFVSPGRVGEKWDASLMLGASGVLLALSAYFFAFVMEELGVSFALGLSAFFVGVFAMIMNRGPHKLGWYLGLVAVVLALAGPIVVFWWVTSNIHLDLKNNAP